MGSLPSRIAILGCTGNLGSILTKRILSASEVEYTIGIGQRPFLTETFLQESKFNYIQGNLLKLQLASLLVQNRIDCIVYLPFISQPTHDEWMAFRTNVLAASRVFEEAGKAGIKQLVLVSSVAVYGPRPNGQIANESDSPSPSCFQFSSHKFIQEQIALMLSIEHGFHLTIVRPCTVVGPNMKNFLLDILCRPLVLIPRNENPIWQFLHQDDFCDAILALLGSNQSKIYNIVPNDSIPLREAIMILGSRPISIPYNLLLKFVKGLWSSPFYRFAPVPVSALAFLTHPPVASNDLIRKEQNVEFRFDCREAIRSLNLRQ